MAVVRIEMIVLEVEHFTSTTVNLTARGAEFVAWFEKHDGASVPRRPNAAAAHL
jgi:hypothetical protein